MKKKKKWYWSEFSLLLWVYTAPHSLSQTAKRKANTEGKNIQGELADASLRQHPFHGDYSSERRRRCAFLWETRCFSLLRSQFPRATGGRKATFFCVYRHGQYFITSLFTWSKTRSSAVPVGDTAFCLWSGICDPQLKTQKEYPTVQVFLEVAQWQKNMGICGYLAVPGKCLVVLGLKLLFLVPAGVPARSGDSVLKDNITVRQGDSAVLK